MANPNPPSWWETWRGKRTKDIHLPAEMGSERDPRLPPPTPFQTIRENMERIGSMNDAVRQQLKQKVTRGR